jgi:hypothetical protein
MDKSCEQIEMLLVDYSDGRLSQIDSKKVAEHLEKCEHCQKILEALNESLELAEIIWDDSIEETKKIRISIPGQTRKIHWIKYVAAAAGIILLLTTSIVWRSLFRQIRHSENEINFTDIERRINEAGNAARLLAATELLTEYPDTQSIVKEQYRHIIETYPQTATANKAKLKIQKFN